VVRRSLPGAHIASQPHPAPRALTVIVSARLHNRRQLPLDLAGIPADQPNPVSRTGRFAKARPGGKNT